MVANFWRALQHEPEAVAEHADNPVNEADQHARHLWLCSQDEFRERMKTDPDFYDSKIAGWWVWGQCIWIGSGWCAEQRPHLGDAGTGVAYATATSPRERGERACIASYLTSGTRARAYIEATSPRERGDGRIASDLTSGRARPITAYMRELAERLRSVRVCCGDWARVCGPSVTVKHGITGVFLDPPYADEAERTSDLYSQDSGNVAHAVREWALRWAKIPAPESRYAATKGSTPCRNPGNAFRGRRAAATAHRGTNAARDNSARERIWFSPHCLRTTLFSELQGDTR